MTSLDYLVLTGYVLGIFAIGGVFSRKIKTSSDMFAAGGQSPWWVSGLSGFMTMFSAGTFVVWGGIAACVYLRLRTASAPRASIRSSPKLSKTEKST